MPPASTCLPKIGGIFGGGSSQPTQQMSEPGPPRAHSADEDRDAHLVSYVLDDVQQQWTTIFEQNGKQYRHAKLVLFRDATYSGCGTAQASTGPFYCPQDGRVYLDLGFFRELSRRFGAPERGHPAASRDMTVRSGSQCGGGLGYGWRPVETRTAAPVSRLG